MKKRLETLQKHIEKDLIHDLPVRFHILDYTEQASTQMHKIIKINTYQTEMYYSTPHYKPISKCLLLPIGTK